MGNTSFTTPEEVDAAFTASDESVVVEEEAPQTFKDQKQHIASATEEAAGGAPLIDDLGDPFVDLPRGLFSGGTFQTKAEVKELTGADEEYISKFNSGEEFFDAVLSTGVVQVGSLDLRDVAPSERSGLLSTLLVGERSYLFIAIARLTFGNERDYTVGCQKCETEVSFTLDLEKDLVLPDTEVKASYDYTTGRGDKVTFRLATGADEKEIFSQKSASVAQQSTLLMASCLVSVNDNPEPDPRSYMRNLSMRDREALREVMDDLQPSVDTDVEIACSNCGHVNLYRLGLLDLFRP